MSLTLLLDLDDTLLNTNLPAFMPAYFQAISNHVCGHVPSDKFLHALIGGVNRMNENKDPRLSLREVFDTYFYPHLGIPRDELQDVLEDFYDSIFPSLAGLTTRVSGALEFIRWAELRGIRLALATDPLFPQKATYQRLRWAGFDPEQFELISTYENFHFTKAHPAYYAEVLASLGWPDGPVVMAGNDPSRDILPAQRLGLTTFLVVGESASGSGREAGSGSLTDLRRWIESADPSALEPAYKSRDASLAILSSTPAVLPKLLASLSDEACRCEPTSDDWAMNEIICHLRDTEREVHAMQIDLLLEKDDAFIPRPNSDVWANERNYRDEDPVAALADFSEARVANLNKIGSPPADIWNRRARHAIFGPSTFLEVMSFVADHDRLHLQQVRQTVQSLAGQRVQST